MPNPALEALADYPFDRLRTLLGGEAPPAGVAPIVLSVGEPRHAPPAMVAEVLAAHAGDWGRYPPVDGTPAFRHAVAGWLRRRYNLPEGFIDPDRHLLPVAGTREALFLIAHIAVNAERGGSLPPAVLMPNPFYQVYFAAAVVTGAEPVFLAAGADSGFLPDLGAIAPALLERTALLYLCSPANPQGAVAGTRYLSDALALAQAHGFLVVVDECYGEIYDRDPPPGALTASAALGAEPKGVVVFHSLSKRSSVPGLRSGFVAGDAEIIAQFRRLRAFVGATVPVPVLAASAALWQDEAHVEANRALYRAKFDLAERLLADRFGFFRPSGGFFLWLNVGAGEAAARRLWTNAGLRVLPGAYLARPDRDGGNPGAPFIRVALIETLATTEEALSRLVETL